MAPVIKDVAASLKFSRCLNQVKAMIAEGHTGEEMRQVAIREGMTTLREDAWKKVRHGITTYEEALRVTAA